MKEEVVAFTKAQNIKVEKVKKSKKVKQWAK